MKLVKLKDITLALESGRRPKGGVDVNSGNIPSLGAEHLSSDGRFNFKNIKYISADFFLFLKTGKIQKGDILIVKDGATTGKISFVDSNFPFSKAAINEHIFRLKINNELASPRFIFLFLKTNIGQEQILKDFRGATVGGISRNFIELSSIPLPPLDDQIRIATLLSRVEALISTRKDNLRLLDEFLKSTFLEMFGIQSGDYKEWKIEKMVQHAEIVSGVTKGKKYKSQALIEAPYMRVANVQDGYFNLEEIKTIFATQAEIEKHNLVRGDVLLTEGGDPDKLGRGSVWEEQIKKCIHQNHIFRVRLLDSNEVNPYYLSALIGSIYGKSYFLKAAKQTTGIASINSTQLKTFPLIIPPIDLQNDYAAIANKVGTLKIRYQQSLSELENLYGSLSQRAFKGELDLSRVPLEKLIEPQMDANGREYGAGSGGMSDPVNRERLLRQLFDAFIGERKGASFFMEDFWTQAEMKVVDHMDDESTPLGVADYDKARVWLFGLLKSGQVDQQFNEENNRMELSIKQ